MTLFDVIAIILAAPSAVVSAWTLIELIRKHRSGEEKKPEGDSTKDLPKLKTEPESEIAPNKN